MSLFNVVGRTVVDEKGRLGRIMSFSVVWSDGGPTKTMPGNYIFVANQVQENQYDKLMLLKKMPKLPTLP